MDVIKLKSILCFRLYEILNLQFRCLCAAIADVLRIIALLMNGIASFALLVIFFLAS